MEAPYSRLSEDVDSDNDGIPRGEGWERPALGAIGAIGSIAARAEKARRERTEKSFASSEEREKVRRWRAVCTRLEHLCPLTTAYERSSQVP